MLNFKLLLFLLLNIITDQKEFNFLGALMLKPSFGTTRVTGLQFEV
jgi:hypothetical protein